MGSTRNLIGKALFAAGLLSLPLSANTIQVPLVDKSWTLVGVPGYHYYGLTGTTATDPTQLWETTGTYNGFTTGAFLTDVKVTGTAEERATYDKNATGGSYPTQYSTYEYEPGDVTRTGYKNGIAPDALRGAPYYATVSLKAIDGVSNGVNIISINWDQTVNGLDFSGTVTTTSPDPAWVSSPMRVMYLKSSSSLSEPDIRIAYRAFYEGKTFYLRKDALTATYQATFSQANTFDSPSTISLATIDASSGTPGTKFAGIVDIIDMRLQDNNMTNLNNINPDGIATADTRATLDGNITFYSWDSTNQIWNFAAINDSDLENVTDASDFTELEAGKAYWVKIESADTYAGPEDNTPGLLLGDKIDDNGSALYSTYTNQVTDGWNMMAFDDEQLRYSNTGMIIPGTDFSNMTDVNITNATGSTILSIPLVATDGNRAAKVCKEVNMAVDHNRTYGFNNFNIQCFPAIADGSTGTSSVILLSDRRFGLEYTGGTTAAHFSGARSLTGDNLYGENNNSANFLNVIWSTYGEYALAIQPNEKWDLAGGATQAEARASINCPSQTSLTVKADVNGSSATFAAIASSVNLTAAVQTACGYTGGKEGNATAFSINGGDLPTDMEYVLIAAKDRFYVRDHTFVRVFNYNSGAARTQFRIEGNTSADANVEFYDKTANNRGSELIGPSAVNANDVTDGYANTGVAATFLQHPDENTSIMFWSINEFNFDIKEGAVSGEFSDKFDDITASSETNTTVKGSVTNVYQVSALLAMRDDAEATRWTRRIDGNLTSNTLSASIGDLKYNAIWAENFPTDGPLYHFRSRLEKKPEMFIAADTEVLADTTTSKGTFVSWKQLDVTRDPSTWYDVANQYELFWTEAGKGYWVYVDGAADANPVQFQTRSAYVTGTVTRHFNNTIDSTTLTGEVENHIDRKLTVDIRGLVDTTKLVDTTDTFEIYATINGTVVPLTQPVAGSTLFEVGLSDYETPGVSFEDGTVPITVVASDGMGNRATSTVDLGSTTLDLNYAAPSLPSVTDNGDGTYTITSTNATYIQLYEGNISDLSPSTSLSHTSVAGNYGTTGYTVSLSSALTSSAFPDPTGGITWTTLQTVNGTSGATAAAVRTFLISNGYLTDVRVVGVDGDNDDNSLYSDMYQYYFAPAFKGAHVLEGVVATGDYDGYPAEYTSAGAYSQTLSTNSGVQFKADTTYTTDIYLAYKPVSGATVSQSAPGGQMTITGIGTIIWHPSYTEKPFFIYVGSKLYAGTFVEDIDELSDLVDVSSYSSLVLSKGN